MRDSRIDEIAAHLNTGKRTVYLLAVSGQIPAFKPGGTRGLRRDELDQWIASRICNAGHEHNGVEE